MANYLLDLKNKKSKGTNVLKKVGSKSAYSKLKSTSTKAGSIKKLKTVGGGSAKVSSKKRPYSKGQGIGGMYSVKEYQAYLNKMKAGHKKHGIKTRRKKGYSI
tara:strand:+ start:932 stop:1240 length:309 start_codon:yes stop_codon:yes gene_type:complete